MNIGVDIKALYRGKAGIAVYIARTLDALQQTDTSNNYFLFEKKESAYRIVNPRWTRVVIPSPLPGTLWLMLAAPCYFSKYSIDVFWGPEQIIPSILPCHRVKFVSTVLDVALKRCPETMQTSNYVINRVFLGKSIRRSSRILTISHTVKDDICRFFPQKGVGDKVRVTYPGKPDWVVADTAGGVRGNHVLFVGSFEPRKNLLNLLKAVLLCKTDMKTEIALRIIGPDGWKNASIRAFIKESGLGPPLVSISGYVDEESLIKEYCECKAFVYPSIYEGFGLPVLEALCTATPVLTSRGTSMEEIAGDCCILFDANDPRDIAEKLLTIYRPDFNRAEVLRNRNNVLDKFSWNTTALQTLSALTEAHQLAGV